jgi:acetoin utilization deacetylase AcuC-like enzyme
VGEGRGFTINFPMSAGSGDREYISLFKEHIMPKLEAFRPDIIFISAGFDSHRDDPLAGMDVTDEGYARMTDMLVQFSVNHCERRIVSVLEGGYNLGTLPDTVLSHLRELSGFQSVASTPPADST